MANSDETRWKQRLENFGKALAQLEAACRQDRYSDLERAGLVHRVQGTDGAWRFCAHRPDQAGCPGNHPHFLCLQCGAMVCLTGQPLPHVDVPPGCSVSGKQFVVFGLCSACREQGKAKKELPRANQGR